MLTEEQFMKDLKDFVKTVFEDRGICKITDPEALKDMLQMLSICLVIYKLMKTQSASQN